MGIYILPLFDLRVYCVLILFQNMLCRLPCIRHISTAGLSTLISLLDVFFYDFKNNLFKELDRVVPRKHTVECEDCEDVEKKKCKVEYWDLPLNKLFIYL